MKRLLTGFALLCGVAACGGGGGGGSPAVPPTTGGPGQAHSASDTVRVTFPKAQGSSKSRPAFLTPNTASFSLVVYTVNGATPNPQPTPLAIQLTNTQYCTTSGTGTTCTVNFSVPISTAVVIEILTFDANGNQIGGGFIGPVNTTLATIPTQTITVGGVLATIAVSAAALSAADDGTSHTLTFTVTGKDADGNTILPPGDYPFPITLAVTGDPNVSLSLSPATIASPGPSGSTTVTLTYNSAKVLAAAANISVNASGATPASLTFAPIIFTPTSLPNLLTGGATQTFAVSEPAYSGAFTITGTSSVATVSCTPANCTPATAGAAITVNVAPGTAGAENVSVTDANGGFANIPITVTSSRGTTPIIGAPTIYEYLTPPNGTNYGITVGPDGQTLWYVDRFNSTLGAVVNPASCNGTQVSCAISEVPNPQGTTPPGLQAITSGSDGNLYYTGVTAGADSGGTFEATCTAVPSVSCTNATFDNSYATGTESVLSAPDGNLYATSSYGYLYYESAVGGCCNFSTVGGVYFGSPIYGLTVDPGGTTMWFTDTGDGDVGYFALPCGSCLITEKPSSINYGGGAAHRKPPLAIGASAPKRPNLCPPCLIHFTTPINGIVAAPDGNLYLAEAGANRIDRLSPSVWTACSGASCTYTTIPITIQSTGVGNASAAPQNFAIGPDGNVWFTDSTGYVGFVSLQSCATTCKAYEFSVGGSPWGITKGPDGNIWFTDSSTNKIGEVVLQ